MAESDPIRHVITVTEDPKGTLQIEYARHRGAYPQPWTRELTRFHTLKQTRARLLQLAYRITDAIAAESAEPEAAGAAIADAIDQADRELMCGCRYNVIDPARITACHQHQATPAAG